MSSEEEPQQGDSTNPISVAEDSNLGSIKTNAKAIVPLNKPVCEDLTFIPTDSEDSETSCRKSPDSAKAKVSAKHEGSSEVVFLGTSIDKGQSMIEDKDKPPIPKLAFASGDPSTNGTIEPSVVVDRKRKAATKHGFESEDSSTTNESFQRNNMAPAKKRKVEAKPGFESEDSSTTNEGFQRNVMAPPRKRKGEAKHGFESEQSSKTDESVEQDIVAANRRRKVAVKIALPANHVNELASTSGTLSLCAETAAEDRMSAAERNEISTDESLNAGVSSPTEIGPSTEVADTVRAPPKRSSGKTALINWSRPVLSRAAEKVPGGLSDEASISSWYVEISSEGSPTQKPATPSKPFRKGKANGGLNGGKNSSRHCGECRNCQDPRPCQECSKCLSTSRRECVFAKCENVKYGYQYVKNLESLARETMEKSRNRGLRQRFEFMYGKTGLLFRNAKHNAKSAVSGVDRSSARDKPGSPQGYINGSASSENFQQEDLSEGSNTANASDRRKPLKVGTRILCVRPATKATGKPERDWGKITRRWHSHPRGSYKYDVKYENGEKDKGVDGEDILTEEEYNMDREDRPVDPKKLEVLDNSWLVGKSYHHRWLRKDLKCTELYGKVTDMDDTENVTMYTITIDDSDMQKLREFGLGRPLVSPTFRVSGPEAWGGFNSFCKVTGHACQGPDTPFHHNVHVPVIERTWTECNGKLPTIIFTVKGFRVNLKAKQTEAKGMGLFARIEPLHDNQSHTLRLEAGELVDLGVYGPLRLKDVKEDEFLWVKNFVFGYEPEGWAFSSRKRNLAFDITSDATARLHSAAETNILVYTNETDGKEETPSAWPSHDPEGAIHYYLGHSSAKEGPLELRADNVDFELLVDYGQEYEKVRVRKKYPRVGGTELDMMRREIELDEASCGDQILETFTLQEVLDLKTYLEDVLAEWNDINRPDTLVLGRAVIASLLLFRRFMDITSGQHFLVQSFKELVEEMIQLFDYAENGALLFDNKVYAAHLRKSLGFADTKDLVDVDSIMRKVKNWNIA